MPTIWSLAALTPLATTGETLASLPAPARRYALANYVICSLLILSGCALVPLDGNNPNSYHLVNSDDTRIARRLHQELSENQALQLAPGNSAIRLQATGYEAWEDRLLLAQLADHSLDLQYFSWATDESGLVLMNQVVQAARRGVRVRLLLDDMLAVNQEFLAKVNAHENIEVRLFNPFSTQRMHVFMRPFEWLTKERVNVRMHNKVIIADGAAGIVGGRNIQNRYFWVDPGFNQRDLDAVVIGDVIGELQASFDTYWNSTWSVPIERLESAIKPRQAKRYFRALRKYSKQQLATEPFINARPAAIEDYQISRAMQAARLEFIADAPGKVIDREPEQFERLKTLVDDTDERLLLGMAYLVPSKAVMAQAYDLASRGVKVEILTNSMDSINFPAAFSGYLPFRRAFLDLGISLYEFASDAQYAACPINCAKASMGYHSKLMVFDDDISYVGSMNYDPRSIDLNTEAGLIIYSKAIAAQVAELFYQDAGTGNSWRVNPTDPIRWSRPQHDGTLEISKSEPKASSLSKLGVQFWRLMPLADQY
jgi:putative cardiolipin synthase